MYLSKRIGVVVPAHNEQRLIRRTITTMPDFVDRIIIVDDASTDDTARIVRDLQNDFDGRLLLIRHESNRGVGAAICTGYKRALAENLDVVAVMAGDAQMDPDDLPRILAPVCQGTAHYVKGNRLFTGESWRMIPHIRYLGNAALSLLTKVASGYWHVADSQTGYTAIDRETLSLLNLDAIYPRYGYPNDMLVHLNVYDRVVADVPVRPVYRIGETSGIRLRRVIPRMSWLLLKRFLWRLGAKYVIRDFHPLVFFYLFGTMLFTGGFAFGAWLIWMRLFVTKVAPTSAIFSMFLMVTGLQLLLFAMWFDMERNRTLRANLMPGSIPSRRNATATRTVTTPVHVPAASIEAPVALSFAP